MTQYTHLKTSIFFLFFFTLLASATAQVSGVSGRRLILKTNTIPYLLNQGISAEVEYTVLRNRSIQLEIETGSFQTTTENPNDLWDTTMIQRTVMGIFVKRYKNRALGAPFGWYRKVGIRLGNTDFQASQIRTQRITQIVERIYRVEYLVEDIPTMQLSVGWGNQFHFATRFSLDINCQFEASFYNIREFDYDYINALGQFSSNLSSSYVTDIEVFYLGNMTPLSLGMALHISLGVLLF